MDYKEPHALDVWMDISTRAMNASVSTTSMSPLLNVSEAFDSVESGHRASDVLMDLVLNGTTQLAVRPYFGEFFVSLSGLYLPIHGYLSLLVCTFGIMANILNIVVLTRKEMASPTNAILTGLAIADLLVMVDYVPFTVHNYIRTSHSQEEKFSKAWSMFTLFHAHFTLTCHSISTWLTVILAVWRYTSVSFPTESKIWCSMANAKWTIAIIYLVVPLLCVPVYMSFTIIGKNENEADPAAVYYMVNWSEIATKNDELLKKINFWVFSVGTKLVPCILLTYLSLALIQVLVEAEKRRERLKGSNVLACPPRGPSNSNTNSKNSLSPAPSANSTTQSNLVTTTASTSCGQSLAVPTALPTKKVRLGPVTCVPSSSATSSQPSDRTTKMLLAVLLLFLITEFPSGILTLLSGILGEQFFQNVYQPLGEIIDILALINSGINFILYCVMSRLFRKTFRKVFCPKNHLHRNRYATSVPNEYTNYSRKMSNCRTFAQTELGNSVHTTLV